MEASWGLVAPLVVLHFVLMAAALVACVKDEETNGPKWAWILVIILINFFGPMLYFLFGRRK